jgi:hypothetical protein
MLILNFEGLQEYFLRDVPIEHKDDEVLKNLAKEYAYQVAMVSDITNEERMQIAAEMSKL